MSDLHEPCTGVVRCERCHEEFGDHQAVESSYDARIEAIRFDLRVRDQEEQHVRSLIAAIGCESPGGPDTGQVTCCGVCRALLYIDRKINENGDLLS